MSFIQNKRKSWSLFVAFLWLQFGRFIYGALNSCNFSQRVTWLNSKTKKYNFVCSVFRSNPLLAVSCTVLEFIQHWRKTNDNADDARDGMVFLPPSRYEWKTIKIAEIKFSTRKAHCFFLFSFPISMTIFAVYSFSPFFVSFDLWLLAEWLTFFSLCVVHGKIVSALPVFHVLSSENVESHLLDFYSVCLLCHFFVFLIVGFVTFYQFLWFIQCCRPNASI